MTDSFTEQWPARTDTNGTTWYRPVRDPGMGIDQWGWTADPEQAHPDYMCLRCYGHPSRCDCPEGPLVDPGKCTDCGGQPVCRIDAAVVGTSVTVNTPTTKGLEMTNPAPAPFVAGGSAPRTTEWSGYPLPPLAPGRYIPQYNGRRQYLLPNPEGSLPTGYTRATTVAKVLDNTHNLQLWIQRRQVESIIKTIEHALSPLGYLDGRESIWDYLEREAKDAADDQGKNVGWAWELVRQLLDAIPKDDQKSTNATIDLINNKNGGQDSSEFGTAVHDWLAAVDMGQIQRWQVPEAFKPWVDAYYHALARAGFVAVPQYVERVVYNDAGDETVVGCLDRIYRCVTTGELYLGDVKTSKADNLKWSWLSYVVQLCIYARARLMLSLDGTAWEAMPAINPLMALLLHVPSDNPKASQALPYNLSTGDRYLATSLSAREHQSNAKYQVPGLTTPVPSAEALQYVAAYQAIQDARSVDDLNRIWGEYQAVWSDELTTLGHAVARQFT